MSPDRRNGCFAAGSIAAYTGSIDLSTGGAQELSRARDGGSKADSRIALHESRSSIYSILVNMIPLLMCAYRSRYLNAVLSWMRHEKVEEKYRIFLWDNGGARAICAAYGLIAYGLRISGADAPKNVGKAIAMQYLVDIVKEALPDATCYVCMDDDVIVDRVHLDALAEAALRPSLGMIAARFHPFNSVVPPGGTVIEVDPCRACSGAEGSANCAYCRGSGKDPHGLRLRTYPGEDRTEKNLGKIAGTLFAVSKATIAKSQWAPHLYPILLRRTDNQPVLYWGEDANLDIELTKLGLINGYLEMPGLSPAIHLPELDPDYMSWKVKARQHPQIDEFKSEAPLAE